MNSKGPSISEVLEPSCVPHRDLKSDRRWGGSGGVGRLGIDLRPQSLLWPYRHQVSHPQGPA